MRVKLGFVLTPLLVVLWIRADQLPPALADGTLRTNAERHLTRHSGAVKEREAMVSIRLPDPFAADLGDVAEALLAFAQCDLGPIAFL
jgi:hypothetical protein